jgi:hypothetical protein
VEASCGYGFWGPPDLTAQAAQGTDSCVSAWATVSCEYGGDYGGYSSDLTEYLGSPEYAAWQESIDGRAAKVVTATMGASLVAAVHFPVVDPELKGVRLTLWALCEDATGQQDALSALRSITFTAFSGLY